MNAGASLPYGWIQQVDRKSGHIFYVDTKANPPRSIWTHPYEDEMYLSEHPDRRAKVRGSNSFGSDASLALPPPYEAPRRHSFSGRPTTPVGIPPPTHKQGLFNKLKTKAKKSMEQHNERKQQQLLMQQQQMAQMYSQPQFSNTQYAAPQNGYPGYGYRRQRGGMGGMALPLMGGMAGGLVLGDLIGGDMGGGFGGGGFDGGFGGGGFGGF